jgi:MFS superfamily sulfate permease-like transporter
MAADKSQNNQKEPNWLVRFMPFLQWALQYERDWLRFDLIAGVTVAALVIPKALGYAGIARVPIHFGLYAAAAGAILFALFGTSRQISTGSSSALAAVAGSEGAVTLVAAITFVTGLFIHPAKDS